jgi:hypothetical protein
MKVVRTALAVVVAIVMTGCLEPPVSETLEIRMLRGGASVVSVGVALRKPAEFNDSPKVKQRLEAETRALEEGTDPWSARFAEGKPSRERDVRDRADGRLYRVTRQARFDAPEDLQAFLRDTGVGLTFETGQGRDELRILPGRSGRPTAAQRERVKAELASFTAKLAEYFAATADLYAYLDRHPERARPCFGSILTKVPEGESLSEEESALTRAVDEAMSACGAVLIAPPDEPYTIDELSRMVYDPFPAPIRIVVPGTVLERDGFPGEPDGPLDIPTISLWSAFTRLEGRFIAPDPALAAWRQDRAKDGKEIDLEAFAAQARHAIKPDATEVRSAIEDQLRAAPVYRVRWTPGDGEPLAFEQEP